MSKFRIETLSGPDESAEADNVVLQDDHFLFQNKVGQSERTVFVIPAKFIRTIRKTE